MLRSVVSGRSSWWRPIWCIKTPTLMEHCWNIRCWLNLAMRWLSPMWLISLIKVGVTGLRFTAYFSWQVFCCDSIFVHLTHCSLVTYSIIDLGRHWPRCCPWGTIALHCHRHWFIYEILKNLPKWNEKCKICKEFYSSNVIENVILMMLYFSP